jgi:hypothetical protein
MKKDFRCQVEFDYKHGASMITTGLFIEKRKATIDAYGNIAAKKSSRP